MRAARSLFVLSLAALSSLAGCGGEAHDATSKDLSALTAEIGKLRAEQAAMAERLDALERDRKARSAESAAPAPPRTSDAAAAPAAPTLDSDRPALDVVRLGPSDGEGDGDVDDTGPRTVLRSGSNGIVVEEQNGAGGTTRTVQPALATAKKGAPPGKKADKTEKDKADKPDHKKTASLPTP